MSQERADRHRRTAKGHDTAAKAHDEAQDYWTSDGDAARAGLDHRSIKAQRDQE